MDRKTVEVTLLERVDKIRFGMSRNEVRTIMGNNFVEFKKSRFSKNTSDDFHFLHVFYNVANECIAVEVFGECQILINGSAIPKEKEAFKKWLLRIDSEAECTADGATSSKYSIGMSATESSVDSILFGETGYYG